ncbi:MAG: DNA repair protein RecO [Betaproteobacteria bacterium]|nr:DNA repair protein RecO [Betaproteobacteria bacterium]MDE2625127.1 DNA repair protein RecO [Betaproteobacteria bacterium]
MSFDPARVAMEPAFVLHSTPWRETSLIVECFTPHCGRVALVAKGVRRPRSALRGLMQPFQSLLVSWFGQGELRTLKTAEWQGGLPQLSGKALFCGFYLNELLMRLLGRDDPHEALFGFYAQTLGRLAAAEPLEPVLRAFEVALLQELGYAPPLEREADTGAPIDPDAHYRFELDRGALRVVAPGGNAVQFLGKTLLDMAQSHYDDPVTLSQSKQLMRLLLGHHLGYQDLHTRRIFQELPLL